MVTTNSGSNSSTRRDSKQMGKSVRKWLSCVTVLTLLLCLSACAGGPKIPDSAPSNAGETETQSQTDQAIQRDVIMALADEPGLDGTRIGVSCLNGVVTLRGSVDTPLERQLASKAAAQVTGVVEVRNLLTSL